MFLRNSGFGWNIKWSLKRTFWSFNWNFWRLEWNECVWRYNLWSWVLNTQMTHDESKRISKFVLNGKKNNNKKTLKCNHLIIGCNIVSVFYSFGLLMFSALQSSCHFLPFFLSIVILCHAPNCFHLCFIVSTPVLYLSPRLGPGHYLLLLSQSQHSSFDSLLDLECLTTLMVSFDSSFSTRQLSMLVLPYFPCTGWFLPY